MDDNGSPLDYLRGKIRERMNDLADHIAGGGCVSMEHPEQTAHNYVQSVGIISGLAEAERMLLDTVEVLEGDEDEDGGD